tara:strand:+ start:6607 stop:9453 length:2847 start_codon:yes stop_codon:yes gene_type:complete
MNSSLSTILVLLATIINSIVFGYIASNSKNNKTNQSYLLFLTFIILYTIFDCIIIQSYESIASKNFIVKIQAFLWMPLPILFLNFIYLFLRKEKDQLFHLFSVFTIVSIFFTMFTNNILVGYKGFNLGTMAYTGSWFLFVTFVGILPPAVYAFYLIGKASNIFIFWKKSTSDISKEILTLQLKLPFFGSVLCFLIAVSTNIFFDEIFGYSGELHLASLALSFQSMFLLPALVKYNFLNQPIEQLGDELYAHSPDAVIVTNHTGVIVNLNKSARKLFNLQGKIIKKHLQSLLSDKEVFYSENLTLETKTKAGIDISISQTNITQATLPVGKILVIRDISSRKETERSYKNLIKSSGDIIYNLDINGNFTFVNPIFEKITGYARKEVLGKDTNFMVHPSYKNIKKKIFSKLYTKSKKLQQSIIAEVPIITKQNKNLWMELGITTIVKEKKITGFSIISRDITDRKNAENKLLQKTEELRTAQNVAGLGSFSFDMQNNLVTWSDNLFKIYELDKKTFIPTKDKFFNEVVHAESRTHAIQSVENALKNKLTETDYIHKTQTPSGNEKWMHAMIKIVYDGDNPIQMHGTSQDITELYNTRISLEKSKIRLKYAHKIANLGTWDKNHKTGVIYWSPILKKMFGLKKNTIINNNDFWDALHNDDREWMKGLWEKAQKKNKPFSGTFRIQLNNGTIKHLNEHAEFITDKQGKLVKTVGTVIDVTEIHKYQEKLRELSSHIRNVQEEERKRIAKEIHDELGQRLTSMSMDIAFLKNKQPESFSQKVNERLLALESLIDETIHKTRKLSQELRPSILDDLGLLSAIDWLKEQYGQRSDIHFTLDVPKQDIDIKPDYATAVFRITQEALTNIIRHADAKNVNIIIAKSKTDIKLQVIDDGRGIQTLPFTSSLEKTYGVFGMKERATSLGGKLEIVSNGDQGTTVDLTLPIINDNEIIYD